MLNNFRDSLKPTLQKIGVVFAATGLPANFWTAVGLAFAFASAIVYGWDFVFDKIAEVAIFLGILIGGYAEGYVVLLAITLSLLVSYTRARAESVGIQLQGIGIGERAERLLVIAIIGIAGLLNYAVIIVAIIAAITLIQRIVATSRNIKE